MAAEPFGAAANLLFVVFSCIFWCKAFREKPVKKSLYNSEKPMPYHHKYHYPKSKADTENGSINERIHYLIHKFFRHSLSPDPFLREKIIIVISVKVILCSGFAAERFTIRNLLQVV